ncbi:MAG: tight adherence protein [Actinomycetota bacterium]|nr:tight adherence protein [Actinomycetota bacterium]
MPVVIMAVLAAVSLAVLVAGVALLRSSRLEAVAASFADDSAAPARPPLTARFLDGLGLGAQRLLLSLYGPQRRRKLDDKLARAGRPEGMTDRTFLRRKAGFTVFGAIVGIVLWLLGRTFLAVPTVVLCTFWMDIWLRTLMSRRRDDIARQLPDMLDILAVTVSAGLALQTALERTVERDDGALGQEIRRTLNDLRYGMSRRAAFTALRDRNDVPSLSSFVSAMLQAEELGTPLAKALMDIAAEVRRESAQEARQKAAKAGPKVSLVVTLTIMPGAMLLIMSAMVLANLPTFRSFFG